MTHFVPGIQKALALARHLPGFRQAVEAVVESVLRGLEGVAAPCLAVVVVAGLSVDVVVAVVAMVVDVVVVVGEEVDVVGVGAVNPKLFCSKYEKLSFQVIPSCLCSAEFPTIHLFSNVVENTLINMDENYVNKWSPKNTPIQWKY